MHDKAITASSIMDIAGTLCIKFGKEQLKAALKDVQYNSVLEQPSKSAGSLVVTKKVWDL